MKSNANSTINNTVIDLQFDLTCICNGEMRRDLMSIPERDFELSVKCIRSLITTRLHIPLVCQIRLSLGDISLDCLELDENPVLPSRIQKRGERSPYFAALLHKLCSSQTDREDARAVRHFIG